LFGEFARDNLGGATCEPARFARQREEWAEEKFARPILLAGSTSTAKMLATVDASANNTRSEPARRLMTLQILDSLLPRDYPEEFYAVLL